MSDPTKVTIEVAAWPTSRAVLVGVLRPKGDGTWLLTAAPLINLDAGQPQSIEVPEDAALAILPTRSEVDPC